MNKNDPKYKQIQINIFQYIDNKVAISKKLKKSMMKSFKFYIEATTSQQALTGLVGDGHGGWYDKKTGEFTAKTKK